ncbi:TolC family protein [Thauera humireducens]|uniref:TolC family protein n=1 Tax=Thauera humireducens TaxID=1134435 RepID=UPI00311DEAA0
MVPGRSSPPPAPSTALSLKHAFEARWARQPEALSLTTQQEAAQARRDSADSWFVEPPALEVAGKTDQLDSNRGSREYEVGIAVPIWLSGERSSSTAALATAEIAATASRARGAQLRTAAAVRTAYWDWQRARRCDAGEGGSRERPRTGRRRGQAHQGG